MSKVLVTGGTGLVGHGIRAISSLFPEYSFVFLSSKDCDLTQFDQTLVLFQREQPDFVIHLAANVGGLFKNLRYKVEMYEKNILINLNVLKASHLINVKKVISCLSTCIFPDQTTYPIDESMLHQGPPHFSNDAYAYAKRMIEVSSKAYQEQYGKDFVCVIPTNIYGPYDNFHLEDAHVIPALIHKCYLAKREGKDFEVAGSGKPLRQFIHAQDLGYLMVWALQSYPEKESIILSPDASEEVSIGNVAKLIAKAFDYEEKLVFQPDKPDGQFKKTASNAKLRRYLPEYKFLSIEEGIEKTVQWFLQNYENCRH